MLLFVVFLLALCSIAYELILAQSLAAFLENTVLRYSVTIGLYMFSLGVGALLADEKLRSKPLITLSWVEVFLSILGGGSVIFLYLVEHSGVSRIVFSVFAHSLIIIIGVLSGLEIPLLLELAQRKSTENTILGINYFGAFVGTIAFAFLFCPKMGLVASSLFLGAVNAAAGVLLVISTAKPKEPLLQKICWTQKILCFIFCLGLLCAKPISDGLTQLYLS